MNEIQGYFVIDSLIFVATTAPYRKRNWLMYFICIYVLLQAKYS